jgi:hypothetical protein
MCDFLSQQGTQILRPVISIEGIPKYYRYTTDYYFVATRTDYGLATPSHTHTHPPPVGCQLAKKEKTCVRTRFFVHVFRTRVFCVHVFCALKYFLIVSLQLTYKNRCNIKYVVYGVKISFSLKSKDKIYETDLRQG